MALTKAPLFGLDAGGTVGGALVFSKWKGRTYVRRHAVPHNPQSGLQTGMRSSFKYVSQKYVALSAAIIARWKVIADKTATTPMNAQMQASQRSIRLGNGPIRDPAEAPGTTPTIVASIVATPLPKSVVLTWAHPVTTAGNYTTMIWMSKTGTFTRSTATLIAVLSQSLLTFTVPKLITGQAYFFEVAEANGDGTVGVASAEATTTVL